MIVLCVSPLKMLEIREISSVSDEIVWSFYTENIRLLPVQFGGI